jgi:hypothetical protein
MKKCLLIGLIACFCEMSLAADIDISGPSIVCPNVQVTYTATATNAFGAQGGCFQWIFYVNDQVIDPGNSLSCDCDSYSNTSSKSFIWNHVSDNAYVRVRFLPRGWPSNICPIQDEYLNVMLRVNTPDNIIGLSLCSNGGTSTVSITNSLTPTYCNWDHHYDWIIPAGWTAAPYNSPYGYAAIPGGIRTKANVISLTAPGPLIGGFSGNYFVTVRTGPAWPWPKEVTRQVWVGAPNPAGDIVISNGNVAPGSTIEFVASDYSNPNIGQRTYNWDVGGGYFNYVNGPYASVTMTADYIAPSISISNACGTSEQITRNWVYDNGGGNGCPPGMSCETSVFPNPAADEIMVQFQAGQDQNLVAASKTNKKVVLYNQYNEKIISMETSKSSLTIPVENLPKGIYLLEIHNNGMRHKKRVVINH